VRDILYPAPGADQLAGQRDLLGKLIDEVVELAAET
jgi:hypothetical protein